MDRVLAGFRRRDSAWFLVVMLAALAVVSVSTGAVETSVPDEWIRDIISMPEGTLGAMQAFVETVDSPDTDADTRREMLANPQAWLEQNYGIAPEDAVFWTVDTTVAPPEDGKPWLFESQYLGEDELMQEAVVFSGPNLCLFIQTSEDAGAPGGGPDAVTQRFLEVISSRSEEEWNSLRSIVLDVNRADDEEKALFEEETRKALISYNQRLSGANTRLLVIDLAVGAEYGAVHFGEIPAGMVMTPQGLTIIGRSVLLVYGTLF